MNAELQDFDVMSIPAEFNPLAEGLGNRVNQSLYAGDDKLFVQFRTDPVLNPFKSTKAGRPIYDEVDMIIIRTPGSQLTSVIAPAKYYMDRFGIRYKQWKENQQNAISGTPLENFPFMFGKPGLVAEMKAMNIFTVEQLAEVPDNTKQRIMGGYELCEKAAKWLKQVDIETADAEKTELKARLAEMEAKMAALLEASNKPEQSKITLPVKKG